MVIGVVALIVVIAGGWYLLSTAPVSPETAQPAAVGAVQMGSGTIGDILAMGPSQCTVTVDQSGVQSQGIVVVAGGKMAGDFATDVDGQMMHTYLINDGATVYTWSDQSAQGFKVPVTTTSATSSASGSESQLASATTPAEYSCQPWVEDASIFTPPASVTFVDPSAMPAGMDAAKKPAP